MTFEVKLEEAGSENVIRISSCFRSRITQVYPCVIYLPIVEVEFDPDISLSLEEHFSTPTMASQSHGLP